MLSRLARFSTLSLVRKDPWPLPNTPEHIAYTHNNDNDNYTSPPRIPRIHESISTLRARLLYQSRKRGTLETDLLLSTFARDNLDSMSEQDLHEYDKLLDEPDWDIYYWSIGKRSAPATWSSSPVLARLVVHAKNEGKVVRTMPALHDST